jgi:hypothetical protein
MSRYSFRTDHPYAACLVSVRKRPLENDQALAVSLLRLEFEVFWKVSIPKRLLRSHGEIACRDLLVGKLVPSNKDSGQLVYATAMNLDGSLDDPDCWVAAISKKTWVEIVFGEADPVDSRNPFKSIRAFSIEGWKIERHRYDRTAQWVSVAEAAEAVCMSRSTLRRRVDRLEADFGSRLIRRTRGNQRRIYLPLFLNICCRDS